MVSERVGRYILIHFSNTIDWSAGIIEAFTKDDKKIPLIILPIYVFISNFIILNSLIAVSCEYFAE